MRQMLDAAQRGRARPNRPVMMASWATHTLGL